jgi:hypothetical protein
LLAVAKTCFSPSGAVVGEMRKVVTEIGWQKYSAHQLAPDVSKLCRFYLFIYLLFLGFTQTKS